MSRLARSSVSARRALAVLVTAGLAVATVACAEPPPSSPNPNATASASASPGPSLPPVGSGCTQAANLGRPLRLTNGAGLSIAAVDLGSGPTAVVLAHQSDGSLCEWMPYGETLAAKGYRVLAFDFAGSGSSSMPKQKTYVEDIRTAVVYLREQGVKTIVIIGASMGATMSVVAGAAILPPVDGLVAVSPPLTFDGVNAEKAAPSLRTPTLYIAGDTDGDFATYSRAIYNGTPGDLRDILIVKAQQHGLRLFDAETQATLEVRNAVESFLSVHAPLNPVPSSPPS
jgi:predicted alpha/beta-hydrolase family hydrolase